MNTRQGCRGRRYARWTTVKSLTCFSCGRSWLSANWTPNTERFAINWHNILDSRQDAEECVNDAYLGTWNAIPPQRPDPLLPFVCVLVRRYSIMRYRANTAMKRNSSYDACMEEIENCIAAPGRVEDHYEAKVLARTIERFLDTLNRENRVIFMRRYWYSDSYAAIAALTGLTEKNVSVRLARVRKQLRDYLMKQGVLT